MTVVFECPISQTLVLMNLLGGGDGGVDSRAPVRGKEREREHEALIFLLKSICSPLLHPLIPTLRSSLEITEQ